MRKFFITFVSAFAVLVVISAVSCARKDDLRQEYREPNMEVIAQCMSNMGNLFDQLNAVGNQVKMGTRTNHEFESQARQLVNEMSYETQVFLIETGWTDADIDEIIEECGADVFATLGTYLGVGQKNGLTLSHTTDGTIVLDPLGTDVINKALTWGEVGGCALGVLGLNVLDAIKAGGAITITAIKLAFKTAAKALLGPVGLVVAIVEFGICIGAAALD